VHLYGNAYLTSALMSAAHLSHALVGRHLYGCPPVPHSAALLGLSKHRHYIFGLTDSAILPYVEGVEGAEAICRGLRAVYPYNPIPQYPSLLT
jgi:hypothetical protein